MSSPNSITIGPRPILTRDLKTLTNNDPFNNIQNLIQFINNHKNISLIELFHSNVPFRAYFDIDIKHNKLPATDAEELEYILDNIVKPHIIRDTTNYFLTLLQVSFNIDIPDLAVNYTLFDNSDRDKVSFHLIFPHIIFINNDAFISLAKSTATYINDKYSYDVSHDNNYHQTFIDMSPIDRTGERTLRVPYTEKYDRKTSEFKRKKVPNPNTYLIDFGLVSYISPHPDNVIIGEGYSTPSSSKSIKNEESAEYPYLDCLRQMEQNYPDHYKHYNNIIKNLTFNDQNRKLITFYKSNPYATTYCPICEETHHNDRALCAYVNPTHIHLYCMQNQSAGSILFRYTGNISYKEEYPTSGKTVKELQPLQNYITAPKSLLFIKASTGYGKTNFLLNYINKHSPNASIVAVSNRQTFAANFTARQNSTAGAAIKITNYRDIDGPISLEKHKRVIVQNESVHRINDTRVDILIFDELVSILKQFKSTTMAKNNPTNNFIVFTKLIQNAKIIICLDAYLTNADTDFIKSIRGECQTNTIIINKKAANPPNVKIHKSPLALYPKIENAIKSNIPIAICTSISAEKMIALAEYIKTLTFGSTGRKCRILCLTSKTSPKDKAEILGERFSTILDEIDVFIYTPTLTAGVSYEHKRFQQLFAIFSRQSASVFDCAQMVNRIRDYQELNVTIIGHYSEIEDCEEVKNYIRIESKRLGNNSCIPTSHIDGQGFIPDEESPAFKLWFMLLRRDRFMRNRFDEIFIDFMRTRGSKITYENETTKSSEIPKKIKSLVEFIEQSNAESIAKAPQIDEQVKNDLLKIRDGLKEEELAQLKKYNMFRVYNANIANADSIKVAINPRNMRIYSHRRHFFALATLREVKNDEDRLKLIDESFKAVKTIDYSLVDLFEIDQRERIIDSLHVASRIFKYPIRSEKVIMNVKRDEILKIHELFKNPQSDQDKDLIKLIHDRWKIDKEKSFQDMDAKGITKLLQNILNFTGFKLETKDKNARNYILYDEFFDIFEGVAGVPNTKEIIKDTEEKIKSCIELQKDANSI